MVPDIKNILFATDLSENARYAFTYASAIANRFGAAITILHVLEELSPSGSGIVSENAGRISKSVTRKKLLHPLDRELKMGAMR